LDFLYPYTFILTLLTQKWGNQTLCKLFYDCDREVCVLGESQYISKMPRRWSGRQFALLHCQFPV